MGFGGLTPARKLSVKQLINRVMTKYNIAREIEATAKALKYDVWGLSRNMTTYYDAFTKAELLEKLANMKNDLANITK